LQEWLFILLEVGLSSISKNLLQGPLDACRICIPEDRYHSCDRNKWSLREYQARELLLQGCTNVTWSPPTKHGCTLNKYLHVLGLVILAVNPLDGFSIISLRTKLFSSLFRKVLRNPFLISNTLISEGIR